MTISCDADTAYNAYDAVATVIDEVWSFEIAEPVNVFSAVILVLAEPVKLFNAVISVEPPPPPKPNAVICAELDTIPLGNCSEPLMIPLGNCSEPLMIPLGNCAELLIVPLGTEPPPVPNPNDAADLETSVGKSVILEVVIGSI